MKKHFKKRQLYFFLEEPYPENIWLSKKLIWPKRKIIPNVKRPLQASIKHLRYLKKNLFLSPTFKQNYYFLQNDKKQKMTYRMVSEIRIRKEFLNQDFKKSFLSHGQRYDLIQNLSKKREFFFLFTREQASSHVLTPFIIYKKVSHYYKSLQERKKFLILYGIKNQKKLKNELQKGGKYALSLCELKIDVLWKKTGMFSNISQIQNEMHQKRMFHNGSLLLSPSISCQPGEMFQYKFQTQTKNYPIKIFYEDLKKKLPRIRYKLLLKYRFFENKKSIFLLKKILFYKYFRYFSFKEIGKK